MRRLLWDTTLEPCEYPQIIKDIFFKESVKNRLAYTSWVGKISNKHKKDLDWWLTAPPSRNPPHLGSASRRIRSPCGQ